jgi:hypothetical protein
MRIRSVLALLMLLAVSPASAAGPELSWDELRNITTHSEKGQDVVAFMPSVQALDGQIVTVSGWITPINLGDGTTVTSFLLTGTPGTCPFCAGFGPESFVLVEAADPVPTDVTVELLLVGKFRVIQDDPTGFYYHLQAAHVIGHP